MITISLFFWITSLGVLINVCCKCSEDLNNRFQTRTYYFQIIEFFFYHVDGFGNICISFGRQKNYVLSHWNAYHANFVSLQVEIVYWAQGILVRLDSFFQNFILIVINDNATCVFVVHQHILDRIVHRVVFLMNRIDIQ